MYHIICAGRQVGKSFLCMQLLLYFAINNPKWQCMYVSMTYAQSGKLFKELLNGIAGAGIVRKKNKIENSVILRNGSEIYFKSYQNPDSIRGYSVDFLIIDEAAFLEDEDFFQVFRPTLSAKGKKCILCSSPRGYNYFHDLWQQGHGRKSKHYKSYFTNYKQCPFSNKEEIADAKKSLPDKIFRAEYLGEFVDGGMSVFDKYRDCIRNPKAVGGKCFAAIDVGRQNDYTVLTVMRGRRVEHISRWNKDTWENIIKNIIVELKKYKPQQTYIEVNGVGDVFYAMVQKELKNNNLNFELVPWQTTNQSKQNIIEKLINDFNTLNISIPNYDVLLGELSDFECSFSTKTRTIQYGARAGKHDDCVMSLAICNWFSNHKAASGTYIFDFV